MLDKCLSNVYNRVFPLRRVMAAAKSLIYKGIIK